MFSKHHSMYNTCIGGKSTADHVPILSSDKKIPVVMNYILAGCQINNLMLKSCSEMPCSGTFRTLKLATSFPEFQYL